MNATRPVTQTGIAALGLKLPSLAVDVREVALARGVDPAKCTVGLGCEAFAVCAPGEGVVDLAAGAAERALRRWGGDPADLGLLAVGTETAADMSRPLSAFVAERLGLSGRIRSYEVKHACYGGTLALRQAVEWRASGAARGRAALVIAADVARYAPESPAEPTQGAGAVAFVVEAPAVAAVALDSHAWSRPAFDFWRPVGEPYPRVEGPLSLDCYKEGALETFRAWLDGRDAFDAFDALGAIAFHVPFPKMVRKAWGAVAEGVGLDEPTAERLWRRKVAPTLAWNQQTGNAYTASLWVSVAAALRSTRAGDPLLAFSYGSGFGAELLELVAGGAPAAWVDDVEADLAARRWLDGPAYVALRRAHG